VIFDNSAKGNLDLGHDESDVLQFDAVAGRAAYIVVAGNSYPDVIENLTEITGRQPLPPRWALGNFASRFGYRSQRQTEDVVKLYQQLDIPLDAIVLDLYWFGKDVKGHMGNLAWDRNAFPAPENMMLDFTKQGIKTVLITEPFVLTTSKMWESAEQEKALAINLAGETKRYDFFFGNTGLIDVFSSSGQKWYKSIYEKLAHQGVAGWWGDLGEPEVHPYDLLHQFNGETYTADTLHNVYGHKWAELVYQQHLASKPDSRPLVLMRSGFVGSQRYGMIPWTGDVSRSWGGLKPQVELALQMSMFGLAYTHSDLGGFAGGEEFDKELYLRWLQFGVFQPVYRPHAQEDIAPEPIFHDKETQDIARDYIKLRYALLPYNYSLSYQNSISGMPLMRPMSFINESKPEFFDIADQYFWGDAFLIKPITDPGINSTDVLLPNGIWFDYWTKEKHQGNQLLTVKTQLSHLPVFVRAGEFVPLIKPVSTTQQYSSENLVIEYYLDDSILHSDYVLFDDDGKTPFTIQNENYQTIELKYEKVGEVSEFSFSVNGKYKGQPQKRQVELIIYGWVDQVADIKLGNKSLQKQPYKVLTNDQYSLKAEQQILHILFEIDTNQILRIN